MSQVVEVLRANDELGQLSFLPDPAHARTTRQFVERYLAKRRVCQKYVEAAVLVASEAATNAISASLKARMSRRLITLTIELKDSTLQIAVADPIPSAPPENLAWPADIEENGRGLLICEALCTSVTTPKTSPDGKTVLFIMEVAFTDSTTD